MSNSIVNDIVGRWFAVPPALAAQVDCGACTRTHKCCDFQPFVANFYCGAMLEAGLSPFPLHPGKASAQPLGVMATADFRARHQAGDKQSCTHYDSGRCRIWRFRPGECSMYFCTEDSGRVQRADWSNKIFAFETAVAQMALANWGMSASEIAQQVDFLNWPPAPMPVAEVEEVYRFSWSWLRRQDREEVLSWLAFDNSPSGEYQ